MITHDDAHSFGVKTIIFCNGLNLSLSSLPKELQTELEASSIPREATVLFEYGRKMATYWDGPKLLEQVLDKVPPLAKSLYPAGSY